MNKVILVNCEKCVGCRTCEMVCSLSHCKEIDPYHSRIKVIKCDLCDGEPLCVKFCAYGTLDYVDTEELNKDRQTDAAEKIFELSSKCKISLSNIKTED